MAPTSSSNGTSSKKSTRKGPPLGTILHDGFILKQQGYKKDGTSLWYCLERDRRHECRASYRMDNSGTLKLLQGHSRHDPDDVGAEAEMRRSAIRTISRSQPHLWPRDVIKSATSGASEAVLSRMGSHQALAKIVTDSRRSLSADLAAANADPPEIIGYLSKTIGGSAFLQHDSSLSDSTNPRIIVFASDSSMNSLCGSSIFLVDGTFDVVASNFAQLLSIYAQLTPGVFRPAVYALLPDKLQSTYIRVFQILRQLPALSNWAPAMALTDLDVGLRNAIAGTFSNIRLSSCWFHLSDAWRRKIEELKLQGLVQPVKSHYDVYMKLQSLPFIPETDVPTMFNSIYSKIGKNDPLIAFLDYLKQNYVDGVPGRNPLFPPSSWNLAENMMSGQLRSNNNVESWHKKLASFAADLHGVRRVQMSQLITKIQAEEEKTRQDIELLLQNPELNAKRRRVCVKFDAELIRIVSNNPPPPGKPLDKHELLSAISELLKKKPTGIDSFSSFM